MDPISFTNSKSGGASPHPKKVYYTDFDIDGLDRYRYIDWEEIRCVIAQESSTVLTLWLHSGERIFFEYPYNRYRTKKITDLEHLADAYGGRINLD